MIAKNPNDLTMPTKGLVGIKTATRPGQLRVKLLDDDPTEFPLESGSTITFGRSRASKVIINHSSVSKIHFSLRAVDGGVELEDLGSKNGTWYAGRRVRRITLSPGDKFFAGSCGVELIDVEQVDVEIAGSNECGSLFGESVAMRELFVTIEKVAPLPLDVLILGETGTGKEMTARTIHDLSTRKDRPFVILDCSMLPANLADATIFGFRRGAFTGADNDQLGLFEEADGGTLFIDEIGELSPELQMKFLRAIDRREVARLGEPSKLRRVDVRVVTATNRDLQAEIRAGRFREDLFHRITHATLYLPPLRDRDVDVLVLAERFLEELELPEPIRIADDARTAIATYDWPGNVRELKNAIRRSAMLCINNVIKLEDLALGRLHGWGHKLAKALDDQRKHLDYDSLHLLVDRIFLPDVLEEQGSLRASARYLKITRPRLKARLHALGLYDPSDS